MDKKQWQSKCHLAAMAPFESIYEFRNITIPKVVIRISAVTEEKAWEILLNTVK